MNKAGRKLTPSEELDFRLNTLRMLFPYPPYVGKKVMVRPVKPARKARKHG
jgi:hypothetical protein